MKRMLCTAIIILLSSFLTYGQESIVIQRIDPNNLGIPRRIIRERDINEIREIESDIEFNASTSGVIVNGMFIKDDIGIDLYETEGLGRSMLPTPPFWLKGIGIECDSMYVGIQCSDTISVRGMPVTHFPCYIYKKDNVKWVTLNEVRKEFCPDVEGTIIYMINKFFITKYVDLYKLDRDYILNVETVDSKEFEMPKDFPPFTIIRIFTKTRSNWHWEGKL